MEMSWQPKWWKQEDHGSAWSRVREAMKRDWEQTKKDLHAGGHELNQKVSDTVKQVSGKENIPPFDKANPPKVIGNWDDVEFPVGYGYGAHKKYGTDFPQWNDRLESTLKSEWDSGKSQTHKEWNDVKRWVRHGYEYKPKG
jgi:hypothetical protein